MIYLSSVRFVVLYSWDYICLRYVASSVLYREWGGGGRGGRGVAMLYGSWTRAL